jgi:pyridoxamine 5'-phosphate oxidase
MTDVADPIALFANWYAEARSQAVREPTAVALATVSVEGKPSVRMVLLKSFDARGFVFFTNFESRKGAELLANPNAALCFYWDELERQVRVEGACEAVTKAEADAYFASRARDSQIGAWASEQSRPMATPNELQQRVAEYTERFAGSPVPRPGNWSGFRLVPQRIELWQGKPFRLHERRVFTRAPDGDWSEQRLFP